MAPTPTLVDFQKIVVASLPTPGMGLALDYNGKIPSLKKLLGCDYGQVTLTFPGGNIFANSLTVAHLIGALPASILVSNGSNSGLTAIPVGSTDSVTNSSFRLLCNTVDGQLPALNSTSVFYWFAIA